ncbi:hypothetical protein LR948_09385 [Roseivivax sp. GX 12232]|uniref:hypothetical protein n=1 Tax=Roseivivax sp. GX 12232 TaxID=2900547 RepID=UPI001E34C48F|nr:hypothetical protein [Roseivivax sp. GX 12232]MCE0505565.1 hypothetical protein [Roseivivax sp. GX 12232]
MTTTAAKHSPQDALSLLEDALAYYDPSDLGTEADARAANLASAPGEDTDREAA